MAKIWHGLLFWQGWVIISKVDRLIYRRGKSRLLIGNKTNMQRTHKVFIGIAVVMLVSVMGVGVYAAHPAEFGTEYDDHREKKLDKQLDKAEKKLDSFESRIESAWGMHDGNKRAVTIQGDGSYRVSGVKVVSVNASGNMLTVEFFGFTREVSVAGARLIGGGKQITLADFQVGDMLTGKGTFNQTTRAIGVQEVHNLSYRNRASTDINNRIQALLEQIRKLQEQIKNLRQ